MQTHLINEKNVDHWRDSIYPELSQIATKTSYAKIQVI